MPPFFKLIAISVIWVMISAITIVQLVASEAAFNWIFTVAMFGIAAGVTNGILTSKTVINTDSSSARRMSDMDSGSDSRRQTAGKAKRDQQGGISADMLALLDEEDLAELRRRLKNRLMDRIEGGEDEELSTLESLLEDQDSAPQRRRQR